MKKKTGFVIESNIGDNLKRYIKATMVGGEIDMKAKAIVGLQLLNNVVNGSEFASVVPPIDTGHLRGSGSVFVGGKFIGDSQGDYPAGEPNRNYSDKDEVITIGFDTPYATRMHEGEWTPRYNNANPDKSANVGNKFLERHLDAEKNQLAELYAEIVNKETSKL